MTTKETLQLLVTNLRLVADSLELALGEPPAELIPDVDELPIPQNIKKDKQQKAKVYTTDDVRCILIEKARNGKRQEVQDLLHTFGVDNLSDVPEDKYAELMKLAEEM
jgi:hypothetical protein